MLKKLVKYGNSNALILDRSILALLDISEGSVLKLRIEGDTLIVRAEKNVKPTDVLLSEMESMEERANSISPVVSPMMEIATQNTRDFCKKIEKDEVSMQALKEWVPGAEGFQKLKEAYGKIMQKYEKELKPLSGEKYRLEVQALDEKYKKDRNSTAYQKDLLKLRLKISPGLAEMDKEMQEVTKALGCPEHFYKHEN